MRASTAVQPPNNKDQNSQSGINRKNVGGLLSLNNALEQWPSLQQKGDGFDLARGPEKIKNGRAMQYFTFMGSVDSSNFILKLSYKQSRKISI